MNSCDITFLVDEGGAFIEVVLVEVGDDGLLCEEG